MAYNEQQIELGAGNLYLYLWSGSTEPTVNEAGSPDDTKDVGGTSGASLMYKQEILDVEIDQTMSAVESFMTGESGEFKITIVEQSFRVIAIALGLNPDTEILSSPVSGQYVTFGGQKNPIYSRLWYRVPQIHNTAKYWDYHLYKCMCSSGAEMPFAKKEARKFDMTFKLYPRSSTNKYLGRAYRQA